MSYLDRSFCVSYHYRCFNHGCYRAMTWEREVDGLKRQKGRDFPVAYTDFWEGCTEKVTNVKDELVA